MKHLLFAVLLAFAFFVFCMAFAGCNSNPRLLDWNKTISQQKLKIGDSIRVRGEVYNTIGNPVKYVNKYWRKQGWQPKVYKSMYNPNYDDDSVFDPNAHIGIVMCTIFNPSTYTSLQRIDDMYSTKSKVYPLFAHTIVLTGTITEIGKRLETNSDNSQTYISSISIDITSVDYIDSRELETDY